MSFFSSIGKALRIGVGSLVSQIPVVGPAVGGAIISTIQKRPGTVGGLPAPAAPVSATIPAPAFPGAGFMPIGGLGKITLPGGNGVTRADLPGGLPGQRLAPRGQAFPTADPAGPAPAGYHLDKKTRTYWVRNRRMNPMNHRAAMRAIRRVKAARKMLQKIERQLPKQRTTRRSYGARHITGPRHTD